MESAICLRYCPFPYGSKGLQAARPSRFHLKFNHATPFYVPQFSTTTLPVTRSIKHANCMLERFSVPSENERKSGNKILRGVTAVSLVLACVLGLFNFRGKMNPKFNTAYAWPFTKVEAERRSEQPLPDVSMVEVDGISALKSLLEIMSNQEPSTDPNQTPSKRPPDRNHVKKLKWLAIHKSNSQGNNALKKLEDYRKAYKEDAQTIQDIEVALVEVFMFRGDYKEALKRLDEQIDELIERDKGKPKWDKLLDCYSDPQMAMGESKLWIAKQILYKAILHTWLGDKEADEWWQAFRHLVQD